MFIEFASLICGLALLVLAADWLIAGAAALAARLCVPPLLVGLTLVAFGTSAPELVVTIRATLDGMGGIALGNIVGSNIANVFLVLGLPALFAPMASQARSASANMVFLTAVTGLFLAVAYVSQRVTPVIGWAALAILAGYLACVFSPGRMRQEGCEADDGADRDRAHPILVVLVGLAGVAVGSDLLVSAAKDLTDIFALREEALGLSIIAIGTSLPELATVVAAARRRAADMAIGNVIGSNIFNLLGIIGISSLFGPIPVPDVFLRVDLWVMAAASAALLPYCLYRAVIGRWTGVLMVTSYATYLIYLTHSSAAMSHMTG